MADMSNRGRTLPFLQSALATAGDECILWPFAKNPNGYPVVWFEGKLQLATRIVCTAENGPAPTPKHEAAHDPLKCASRACINKAHLRWATRVENMHDMIVTGTKATGTRHGFAKLTECDVRAIRQSRLSRPAIARQFGVSRGAIEAIQKRVTWKHVTNTEVIEDAAR